MSGAVPLLSPVCFYDLDSDNFTLQEMISKSD